MTLFPSLLRNQNLCILLARYPEYLLSRASSGKAGGRHPRPRSPPAPVELGLVGTEGRGVFGLLRLGAGGVGGWCGDLSRPEEIRTGPCRHGRLFGSCDCVVRGRFPRIGTGVHTCVCVCAMCVCLSSIEGGETPYYRGHFRTPRAQCQLLRCLSQEHPCKPPTYESMHDQFKKAWGAEFRTLGPVASIRLKNQFPGASAGAVGCSIQDPGTRGYRWWKTADCSHSMCGAHGAPPQRRAGMGLWGRVLCGGFLFRELCANSLEPYPSTGRPSHA